MTIQKQKITHRLTESDLKRVISESVKRALKEANLGRGTETVVGSSWSGDEYGGLTHNWSRTRENPYRSDAALMLANRFEKYLGEDFTVEAHVNPRTEEGYNEYTGQEIETSSNYGNYIDFEVYGVGNTNLDDILYVLNSARKVFNKRDIKVYMIGEDGGINISVECSDIINKEPRTTMIPKNGGKAEKGKNGVYTTPFSRSNFEKSEYSSSYEN